MKKLILKNGVVDFSFPLDVIELALKRTTSKTNPSFDYIDKILCDWDERNLKTVTKVQKFLEDMKNKKADIKNLEKKSYNNYEQRKYDNFDSLYANVQKLNIFILYGYKIKKMQFLIS